MNQTAAKAEIMVICCVCGQRIRARLDMRDGKYVALRHGLTGERRFCHGDGIAYADDYLGVVRGH